MRPALEKQCLPNDADAVQSPGEVTIPKTLPCSVAEPRLLDQLTQAALRHGHTEGALNKTIDFSLSDLRSWTPGLRSICSFPNFVWARSASNRTSSRYNSSMP